MSPCRNHQSRLSPVAEQSGDPLEMLRRIKFEPVGFHPIEGHALNIVEQVNQTWTFCVALAGGASTTCSAPGRGWPSFGSGRRCLSSSRHHERERRMRWAETFAAVTPQNNGKLAKDLLKLSARPERHRYVFFMSPLFKGNKRLSQFEAHGIEVWSVDV